MSFPSNRYPHIVADQYEVDAALHDIFELTRGPFEHAVRTGYLESRRPTRDDAPGADGYYAYTRTLRELRRGTRSEAGWHSGSFLRIPVTLNSDESLALTVSSGDELVGRVGEDPSTRNVKGGDASAVVNSNVLRLDGYSPFDEPVDVFYLLFFYDDEGLWAEVSQPSFQDASGRLTGWSVRLILGQIQPDSEPRRRGQNDGSDESATAESIDVPVSRKSS